MPEYPSQLIYLKGYSVFKPQIPKHALNVLRRVYYRCDSYLLVPFITGHFSIIGHFQIHHSKLGATTD